MRSLSNYFGPVAYRIYPFLFCSVQITAFIASLRRVVRIIWSQQLALAEGFDESIVRVLRLRCVGACMHVTSRSLDSYPGWAGTGSGHLFRLPQRSFH